MALQLMKRTLAPNFFNPILNIWRARLNTMAENSVNEINFGELKDKVLNCEVNLIDVREPEELKTEGKIINSVNIPLGKFVEAFKGSAEDFKSKYGVAKPSPGSSIIVLTCRSGKRATDAYLKLKSLGYEKSLVYRGSFLDWVKNGGPLEKK